MPTIEKEAVFKVSPEELFRFLRNPANITGFCANIVSITDVQEHPNRARFAWEYKMIGVHLLGEATLEETKHNEMMTVHFTGGVEGTAELRIEPCDEGSLFQLRIVYNVPQPLERKHSRSSIINQNQADVEQMLVCLRTQLEAHRV